MRYGVLRLESIILFNPHIYQWVTRNLYPISIFAFSKSHFAKKFQTSCKKQAAEWTSKYVRSAAVSAYLDSSCITAVLATNQSADIWTKTYDLEQFF